MMDYQPLSEAFWRPKCEIWALIPSVLHPIRLEYPIEIDHVSEISAINDHKTEI